MPFRLGALVRVSTETQEKQGESLRTQKIHIVDDAATMKHEIVEWYGGQEHATAGWEKKEVDRLIADAAKGKFDAVIVDHADRWSRDNVTSTTGLEAFVQYGIRFFVRTTEYDLFNPEHRLYLGMSAVIGGFLAANQTKKSMENRINRVKRGVPAAGSMPFGRKYDKKAGTWIVDEQKQAMVVDCAKRYIEGASIETLAKEYGITGTYLLIVMKERCGPTVTQSFKSKKLNINETVQMEVPALLPPETIQAVHARCAANRTWSHGHLKYKYLLARMVFCSHCGYAMIGKTQKGKYRYYCHPTKEMKKLCPYPKAAVHADDLDKVVLKGLFNCFANKAALKRAVDQYTPNREKIAECREQAKRLADQIKKLQQGREKVMRLVGNGTLDEEEATLQLNKSKEQIKSLQDQKQVLDAQVENVPTEDKVKMFANICSAFFRDTYKTAKLLAALDNLEDLDETTWDDLRKLAQTTFSGKQPDGKRMGVYMEWLPGQKNNRKQQWKCRIFGNLIEGCGESSDTSSGFYPNLSPSFQANIRLKNGAPSSRTAMIFCLEASSPHFNHQEALS